MGKSDVMCKSDAMCKSYAMYKSDALCKCDGLCKCDALCKSDIQYLSEAVQKWPKNHQSLSDALLKWHCAKVTFRAKLATLAKVLLCCSDTHTKLCICLSLVRINHKTFN